MKIFKFLFLYLFTSTNFLSSINLNIIFEYKDENANDMLDVIVNADCKKQEFQSNLFNFSLESYKNKDKEVSLKLKIKNKESNNLNFKAESTGIVNSKEAYCHEFTKRSLNPYLLNPIIRPVYKAKLIVNIIE